MEQELEKCLLTEEEMALGPEGWKGFDDPLPYPVDDAQGSQNQTTDQSVTHSHDHDHDHDHTAPIVEEKETSKKKARNA
jgi:hypothetical protein